jgi:hypothetical protein
VNYQQQALKEKAAIMEGKSVKSIKKVVEDSKGAVVYYRTTCSPSVRRIPLAYWLGETID